MQRRLKASTGTAMTGVIATEALGQLLAVADDAPTHTR
jgi:hypothetical protein